MRHSTDFTLVTYTKLPDLDPDDQLLRDSLQSRGCSVAVAIWNDSSVDWARAGTCVVRNTWDYHQHYEDFRRWIDHVGSVTGLVNSPETLRWGTQKTYLFALQAAGVDVVPTVLVNPGSVDSVGAIASRTGWSQLVIKPTVGLATSGVKRVNTTQGGALEAGQAHLHSLLATGPALVQPFLPSVTDPGEHALTFVDGEFTHAIRKVPFQPMAVAGRAGETSIRARPDELEVAHRAVAAIPGRALYARVDLVDDEAGKPVVMELEVVEPSLFLSFAPHAAELLADRLIRRPA